MKKQDFENLLEGIKQVGQIQRGEMAPGRSFKFSPIDIKRIRTKLAKSQADFALMIGVSVATLRNWEQGRRVPEGPAQVLLKVVEQNPKAVIRALAT